MNVFCIWKCVTRDTNMVTHLLICMADEEELRTSFLEEEADEEKDRGTLEDLGGGGMEQ